MSDARDTRDDIDAILGVTASPQREARGQAAPVPIEEGRRLTRTPRRRLTINALRADNARDALAGLPADGETWHIIMAGSYDLFDIVPAIIAHGGPIAVLSLATLGFNHANARRLRELLQAGQVRRATMIVSMYYEADHKERDTCYQLATMLPTYGGWYLAARSHAKVIAAELADGRCIVVESSANLRSCRCIEQTSVTSDRALLEFHRGWMDEVRADALARKEAGQ